MADLFPTTLADMIVCVEREIKMRERVYPRWVEQGQMKLDMAEREISVMKQVADVIRCLRQARMSLPLPESLVKQLPEP